MSNGALKISQQNTSGSVCDQVLISLRRIIQSIDLHSRYLVKRVGLTGPQLVILQEVSKTGEVSTGEIARAISLSQATVTGILERLEKRNLVTRQRSDIDRRRVMVRTTPSGEELLNDAPPLMQESFVDEFSRLGDWEQSMILSALQRLVSMMDARNLKAAAILTTGPIDASGKKPPPQKA